MQQPRELAWQTNPRTELVRLAWPIAVSMLSYSFMTVADTAFVGTLGSAALAGVGLAGVVAFTLLVFGLGLVRGVKVLVAQAVGAERTEEVDVLTAAGLVVAFGLGLGATLAGQVVALAMPALSATPESGSFACEYLSIRLVGAAPALLFAALRESRYGLGDARSPMIASVVANIINVCLDYLLVIELDAGVAGAAWATVIANVCQMGILGMLTRGRAFGLLRQGWDKVGDLCRVGIPTGLQFLVEVGAFTVMTVILSMISENELAAHQVAVHVLHFGFLPALAVSEAASVLAGQAVGAERDQLVRPVALIALMVTLAYALFFSVVLTLFAGPIARIFSDDATVVATTVSLLYLAAGFQLVDAAQIVARGVLRGTGDVRVTAIIAVLTAWLCTPPLTWLLGLELQLGAFGAWLGITAEIAVGAAILWWRLLAGGWRADAARIRRLVAGAAQ